MKATTIANIAAAFASIAFASASVQATEGPTTVNVALLDMSSVMSNSMMGQGWNWNMMGNSPNMMGRGWGMMGNGQNGPGPGWGMMGMMGMGMMSIRVDHPTVKAGPVHFAVINWSRAMVHEMLVVAVENPNAPLPYDYGANKVPEEQIKSLGEVDKLEANGSASLDLTLSPGTYLIFCNVEGHYASGMLATLTVTP